MKRIAVATLLTIGLALGFATPAHAGTLTYYRECGPDGNTIVYLTAIDGGTTIYINGIQTSMLVVEPGTHTAEFWGPATNGDGTKDPSRIIVVGTATVTVEPSNCPPPSTPAPAPVPDTLPPAPTDSEVTGSTAPLVPVPTIPQGACPGGCSTATTPPPVIDMDVDPCVTSDVGCSASSTGELPRTGNSNVALLAAAGALLAIGTTLVLVRRPS